MLHLLHAMLATARSSLKPQRELALENLALRQQLSVVQRKTKRPKLTKVDRAFWVALCRLWPDWQNALILVKPQTVIGWHRKVRNHTQELVSIDFFVVPTATFRILYVFLVLELEHERRRIVHFNVTEGPSAQWTGQQLVNAFPED